MTIEPREQPKLADSDSGLARRALMPGGRNLKREFRGPGPAGGIGSSSSILIFAESSPRPGGGLDRAVEPGSQSFKAYHCSGDPAELPGCRPPES
eukprot:768152-Hanusia_phi.AAC.3